MPFRGCRPRNGQPATHVRDLYESDGTGDTQANKQLVADAYPRLFHGAMSAPWSFRDVYYQHNPNDITTGAWPGSCGMLPEGAELRIKHVVAEGNLVFNPLAVRAARHRPRKTSLQARSLPPLPRGEGKIVSTGRDQDVRPDP